MRSFLLALAFLVPFVGFSQSKPDPIFAGPDAPDWFLAMQTENPNVREVRAAFEAFYRTNKFEKNAYTNFYKRWLRWAREFEQADGTLYFPTAKEAEMREQNLLADRAAANDLKKSKDRGAPTWTFIGPKQTYDTDGTTVVTWQTNCYSVDVSRVNSSVVLAGGESGGLYRTTDKGLNWTTLTQGITHSAFTAVKSHPTDEQTFYAATSGKIIKSTNGGATLTTSFSFSGLDVREFAISTTDPNVVIAACEEGILRTTNGGASWSWINTSNTWTVKQKPGDGTTFFAIRKNGAGADFLTSTDSGGSWSVSNSGLYQPMTGEAVTGAIIAVCPSEPARVYAYFCGSGSNLSGFIGVFKSINSGASWANTHPTSAIGNSPTEYSVPAHVNLMSSGGGHNQLEQGFYDMAIFVNPANADQLIAGGTSWWKSTDAGATWTGLGGYAGGLSWAHPDIQCIDGSGSEIWLASDGGLNFSTDFFTTMEARMNGISGADMWGFDSGWNEDILVGGRYHNGNMGWHQSFQAGKFYRLGGGEAPTGYVSPGRERKTYYSDIDGKIFNGGFTAGVTNFTIGDAPNESYAYYANSEMVFHPQHYGVVFLGKNNVLRVSTDGGATFSDKYVFPGSMDNEVYEIEICRSNPQIFYVSQWDGTDDKVWKSTDGGTTFTACGAFPFSTGNNNDRVKLTASATDANIVWASVSYGSNGNKICKSTNGGATWTNLTTSVLNGYTITDILAAHGTDGGVYLGCKGGIFYRNNSMSEWANYSDGLPLEIEPVRLKPFYKEGKIRVGSYGMGVWEAPLFETSTTVALAMVDKKTTYCPRDTFFFDDHSVVNHAGATWSWSFPGAATVIDGATRTPKVIFGTPGTHTATLTLNAGGTDYISTVTVEVFAGCEADTTPGQVLRTAANGDYWQHSGSNLTNLTNFTVTGWWKPNGAQDAYAALFSSGDWCAHCDYTEGLIFDYNGSKLWYKWPGNVANWGSNSGITVPLNEWSYVALVITPSSATMYLNDKKYVHNIALQPGQIENLHIGYGHYSKSFKGDIDEVTMWKKALTETEVRRLRHITREDLIASDPDLIGYWQFTEMMANGDVQDNAGVRHGRLTGGATLAASTAPIGGGSAQLLPLTGGNYLYNFSNIGTSVQMSDCESLAGSMVATRLNIAPNIDPVGGATAKNTWFLNYYSSTAATTFAPVEQLELTATDAPFIAGIDASTEAIFHQRVENGDAATWASKTKGVSLTGSKITFNRKSTVTSGTQISLSDGAPAFSETDPGSPCGLNDGPPKSLKINSSGNYARTNAAVALGTTNTITIAGWIKPTGTQAANSGVFFSGSGGATGLNFRSANQLGYHWADASGSYSWTGGPTVPADVWSHVALVVNATSATVYLNGVPSTRTAAHAAVDFSSVFHFGNDRGTSSRTMNGEMDEVRFYNRALSQNEIRELRHLTYPSYGAADPTLISYYKFDESTGLIYDRTGSINGTLLGSSSRIDETGPFNIGVSQRLTMNTPTSTAVFDQANLNIAFGTNHPGGELCATRLDSMPHGLPTNFEVVGARYWVVNNHGSNNSTLDVTSMVFSGINVNSSVANRYKLYKRTSNDHLDNWVLVDEADAVTTGTSGSITFNSGLSVSSFSQFVILEKGVRVSPKVFLQANYATGTGQMGDNLRSAGFLPTAEPYGALGFGQVEGGGETVNSNVFLSTGNDAIVDWVFVELRDKNNPATKLFTRSALLQKDGDVVDLDGISPVHFTNALAGDYFVAVRHRNHLGAMTLAAAALSENTTALDFTSAALSTFGTDARVDLGSGVLGLWSGDLDVSGTITASDRSLAWNNRNLLGYLIFDANMNGVCDAADRSILWNNRNLVQQLP